MRKIRWRRLGRVFTANHQQPWMNSHTQVPRGLVFEKIIRVYFATRAKQDEEGNFVSRLGYLDVDKRDPTRILNVSRTPALDLGQKGGFDEFGVMPGDVQLVGDQVRLLYTGWSRPPDRPYATWIGEAWSNNRGEKFARKSAKPLLGATEKEKILCNGPFTFWAGVKEHMFYASAQEWIQYGSRQECVYVIMHATKKNGGNWQRDGVGCIPRLHNLECQNAPTVIKKNNIFHVFFCHRHALDFRNSYRGYRLGHAWSDDLKIWHRDDSMALLDGSKQSWEEEMQCYPGIVETPESTYMFYSGNSFGKDGFGVAILNRD